MVRQLVGISVAVEESSMEESLRRRDAYVAAIDPKLSAREDALPTELRRVNASVSTKLHRVYAVVDELTAAARPFVACSNGCSACCHMNVMISETEAQMIAKETGRSPAPLLHSRRHGLAEFSGEPCPFLRESVCSIYEQRPFACRQHLSFHTSDYWCRPEHSNEREMPLVRFSAAEQAYFAVTGFGARGVFADIRDFFPANS